MNHKVEAERFYIPWLYDLAILEKHLLRGSSFRPWCSVTIPYADGSDAYVDTIPNPDLVFLLIYSHSYLEKGLKYLCLIHDSGSSYAAVTSHNLQKAWQHFRQAPASASLEQDLRNNKLWDLFTVLLDLNHPGLRYLDVEKRLAVDIRTLASLVRAFREFLLLRRRDVVFSDPDAFGQLRVLPPRVRAGFPVAEQTTGSPQIAWEEWTLGIRSSDDR